MDITILVQMTFHDSFGYFECVAGGRCGLTWSILGQCLPWMAVHSNESIPGVGNPAERHLRREPARQLRHIRSLTAPPPIYYTSSLPFWGIFTLLEMTGPSALKTWLIFIHLPYHDGHTDTQHVSEDFFIFRSRENWPENVPTKASKILSVLPYFFIVLI